MKRHKMLTVSRESVTGLAAPTRFSVLSREVDFKLGPKDAKAKDAKKELQLQRRKS